LKVCWKSSQRSKSHKNEAQIKNCSIYSDKTSCSKVCYMQFLWNITYQILNVGYGHGKTERKRASLLETNNQSTVDLHVAFVRQFRSPPCCCYRRRASWISVSPGTEED
jgi:hypothetical protein